jgi:phosphoserine phosphatase RsbU/P
VQSRETIRVSDTLSDPRYIPTHPDVRSEVAVPLVSQDRVIGVMDLESNRLGFFTEEHVRALSLLAPQIASSVENARLYEELGQREHRMQEDLRAAYKLQSVLLPRSVPDFVGLEGALRARPAREISGDLYDFFEHGEEYSLIAFGDVSGKGAAAALYGALVAGLLRILAPRRQTPAQLMKLLNETLLERKVDAQYATLLLMQWSGRDNVLTMANAGALPPIICRSGEILDPRVEGVPLGLLEDRDYDQIQFQAQSGDLIVLYSDGIEDQLGEGDKDFGRDRLFRRLKKSTTYSPRDVVGAIFNDIDRFRGSSPLTDDQTLIVLKVV